MSNRLIKQRDYLVAVLDGASTDAGLIEFQAELSDEVGRQRAKAVIVDLGGLDVIDSFTARILSHLAVTLRLRGADPIMVGIHPDVAFAMVRQGLTLDGVATALDLDAGLDLLELRKLGAA